MLKTEPFMEQAMAMMNPELAVETRLAAFRSFYWDTALSTHATTVSTLLKFAEPDHILFGTDWPFAPTEVVNFTTQQFDGLPLDVRLKTEINQGNAKRLFSQFDR